jgi:hypothetical protein
MFVRLGITLDSRELKRIARIYLELVHGLALVIVEQKGKQASRTTDDLKSMACVLLSKYQAE